MSERNGFRIVFDAVVYGRRPSVDERLLREATRIAGLNKVLLHFLRVAGISGRLRLAEEARYRRFLKSLRSVSDALRGLDHVFIKLRKPAVYVPSDIDVLIARRHVTEAAAKLKDRGFDIEVVEPYCVTMVRGDTVVDLYVYPTLGGMIYLDAGRLLERSVVGWLAGIEIPVLETYAEVLITVAHAVYKEKIYTLNDYVTIEKWFTRKTLTLAEELECLDAIKETLRIHWLVEKHRLALPYRIPFAKWLHILGAKTVRDRLTRATLFNLSKALGDPRFGRLIISKLTRLSY